MTSSDALFAKELGIIASARRELEEARYGAVPAEVYEELFDEYQKLLRMVRRLVRMGDRMQEQLREVTAELAQSKEKYRAIFQNAAEGMFRCDASGAFLDVNPAMARLFGHDSPREFCAAHNALAANGYARPRDRRALHAALLRQGEVKDLLIRLRRRDGVDFWAEICAKRFTDKQTGAVVVEGLVADVTERKRQEDALQNLAIRDGLTGLYNRRHAMDVAEATLRLNRERAESASLILFDVDHFKTVNDTHGHDVGDDVLVGLSRRVEEHLRKGDTFARIGGEEFLVILPGVDQQSALATAERLRLALAEAPLPTRSGPVPVTASLGVSQADILSQDATIQDTPESWLKAADVALYQAKNGGRNQCVLAKTPSPCTVQS